MILWAADHKQVTDLHVSRYHTVGGIAHLMHFLQTTLPLISPSIVVATGDLTDAKTEHVKAGVQFEDEWQTYRRLLKVGQAGTSNTFTNDD
jgi:predicted MPP superfamily phosphohydrolase